MYIINKIFGYTIYPDEFGYWASAAQYIGYDWSPVASLGSYYSFGYSIILIPILFLAKDYVLAYRIAVTVNMVLVCISVYYMYQILSILFYEKNENKKIFICGIASLYPVWIFYMQMTLTEGLLMFLFIWVVYLLIKFLEKPNLITAAMLALSLTYTYYVHMRTLGLVIACMIILLIDGVCNPKMRKRIACCFIVMFFSFIVFEIIKENVLESVYAFSERNILIGNDYAGRLAQLKDNLKLSSIIPFIEGLLGKVFYLEIASFGCFFIAIGWCIKMVTVLVLKLFHKKKIILQELIAFFLLLSALGEIFICNISMFKGGVVDSVFYGRYDEFIIPVFILIGTYIMCNNKRAIIFNIAGGFLSILVVPLMCHVIKRDQKVGIRGYFISGMSYVLNEDKFNADNFVIDAWLFGFICILAVSMLIWISNRNKHQYWLMSLIILAEIALGFHISSHYTYRVNGCNYTDLIISNEIKELSQRTDLIYYLDDGSVPYVDFIQMQLGEHTVQVLKRDQIKQLKTIQESDKPIHCLITNTSNKDEVYLKHYFNKHIVSNTYVLYFNEKGEQ